MVMEAPLSRPGSSKAAARAAAKAAPSSTTPALTEIPWTRVDLDLYEVAREGYIVGYVEVVGAVFVALGGPRYDRAVEVSQHLTFHAAVDALVRRVF
ncbi:hypothetical protein QE418_000832 [Microbacterium testaceum]|uniref:hypothetical protein n=1 Tax=Microbacterium TaxID=33882 RepID=UPI0027819E1D|nr:MULTISPECIES: hypothetical protein [Microbacterium]MDQ1111384.1 hypothetical protein [Microbacterium testaceum]MDR6098078.1 hypothetical protein [Microbacterium sp. SORGH_AS_0454]